MRRSDRPGYRRAWVMRGHPQGLHGGVPPNGGKHDDSAGRECRTPLRRTRCAPARPLVLPPDRRPGSLSSVVTGLPVVLLTTTGARTGRPRPVLLLSLRDGDRTVVTAANWGGPRNPSWYYNLLAHPEATTTSRGVTTAVRACEAEGTGLDRQPPSPHPVIVLAPQTSPSAPQTLRRGRDQGRSAPSGRPVRGAGPQSPTPSRSGKVAAAAAGTSTSLKRSIAVCTTAGAQIVRRPASYVCASGTEVTVVTSSAATPTTGPPDVTRIGMCAAATRGIVHRRARPNERAARSRR